MPVYLNNKIKVNDGRNNFVVDTPEIYVNNSTYKYYSNERMYPPTRDLSSASHTISGQAYGNGLYETWESSKYNTSWAGFSAFQESVNVGWHGSGFQYNASSGLYTKTNYIVSNYLGDWIKIKMPVKIHLTKYGFEARGSSYLSRVPNKYKIYGSNDGINWTELVHKKDTDPSLSYSSLIFEESIIMTTESYYYFGLVVNKLIGGGNADSINLNEWYIYGKELLVEPQPIYEDTTEKLQYLAEQKTGVKGWRLVRFLPPTSSTWYSPNDNALGTAPAYGTAYDYTNEWSVNYGGTFDEMFFSTKNMVYWLWTPKTSVEGNYANAGRLVYKSSNYSSQHNVAWYNRAGTDPDPFISVLNHSTAVNQCLYAENSFSSAHTQLIPGNEGMCVFVRTSTDIATVNPEPDYKYLTFTYDDTDRFVFRDDETPYSWQEAYDEAIANGRRMPTKLELLDYLTSLSLINTNTGLFAGDIWCAVVAPEYANGRDYIQIGTTGSHFVGKSHTEVYGYPTWADGTDFYQTKYCEVKDQTSYTLTFDNPTECDILIVAGGGGGGRFGGGGGGGSILFRNNIELNGTLTIKTGNGGIGADAMVANGNGTNGYDSSILIDDVEYIAKGGGGGGTRPNISPYSGRNGNDGGSGGGGSSTDSGQTYGGTSVKNTYTGWDSYGNEGGQGRLGNTAWTSGGGGGAGSVGVNATSTKGGDGGTGKDFITYFGTNVGHNGWFGGGGGGNIYINTATTSIGYGNGGNGLYGGGGNGGYDGTTDISAVDALPNTGGGGGGGKHSGGTVEDENGGHGGSGVVIIRYKVIYIINQWTYSYSNPNTYYLGNVGIGTQSSQDNKLTINGDLNVTNKIYKNNAEISNIDGWNKNGQNIYRETGKVGIGTTEPQYTLDINGDIYAMSGGVSGDGSTSWTTISDRNLKENIVKASYKECYDNIKNIDLYRFNYKKGFDTSRDKHQLGFIAQEIREYYPKSVIETNNSTKGVDNILRLDVTQINYSLFGTVKHCIEEIENIEEKLANNTN